jgi:hypothetical protein
MLEGESHLQAGGQIGFPFFGRLIRDVLDRTETAMTQRTRSKPPSFH